jgi:hypothetical protein
LCEKAVGGRPKKNRREPVRAVLGHAEREQKDGAGEEPSGPEKPLKTRVGHVRPLPPANDIEFSGEEEGARATDAESAAMRC